MHKEISENTIKISTDGCGELILECPENINSLSYSRNKTKRRTLTNYEIDHIDNNVWKISLSVQNKSGDIINSCQPWVCLRLRNSIFSDDSQLWDRTFYKSNGEITSYSESKIQGGTDCHCMTKKYKNDNLYSNIPTNKGSSKKWGFTEKRSDDGIIATSSTDGSRVAMIVFEDAYLLQTNSNNNYQCIHSNPIFGDIEPGQTVTKCGYVSVSKDSIESSWSKYENCFSNNC